MSDHDEITVWINRLAQGEPEAANELWGVYWGKLVQLARQRLRTSPRRVADEEDVALSAFNSFCQGLKKGRFPGLNDRHDLWGLLVTITARKAVAQLRREHAKKRGEGDVCGESVFARGSDPELADGIDCVLGAQPTPELAALAAEQCEILLARLDEDLREVALMKLEGYTIPEIAERLGCVPATIRRRIRRIQTSWSEARNMSMST